MISPFVSNVFRLSAARILLIALLLTIAVSPAISAADDWGHLRGRILVSGDVAPAAELEITRDPEVCGQLKLTDESLIVHPENRGLRFAAVWVDSKEKLPIHPNHMAAPETPPVLDNKDCRFEPRVMAVRTASPVQFSNSDPVAHNVAVYGRRNTPFSEIVPASQPLEKSFAKAEVLPVRIDCSIHAWMKSWLIIQDHPYVAVTDADGNFEIRDLPAGEWRFRFWHERPGNLTDLQTPDGPKTLDKGIWVIRIVPGETTELGLLQIESKQLTGSKKK